MHERIVVALDDSAAADQVLPMVAALAACCGSTPVLLRAITPPDRDIVGAATLMTGGTVDRDTLSERAMNLCAP